jgi:tetratricopeptide (TPR) repeat protein
MRVPTLAAWSLLVLLALLSPALGLGTAAAQEEQAAQRLMFSAQQRERAGDKAGAIAEYRALVERFPGSGLAPQALLRWAEHSLASGDLDAAGSVLTRLLDQHPDAVEGAAARASQARLAIGRARSRDDLLATRAELERALDQFDRARYVILPARQDLLVLLGDVEVLLGDLAAAASRFVIAIEDEPAAAGQIAAREGLARVLLWQVREEALAVPPAIQLLQENLEQEEGDEAALARPRALLSLIDRVLLRPERGQPRWQRVRSLPEITTRKAHGIAASLEGRLAITDADGLITVDAEARQERRALRGAGRPSFAPTGELVVPTQDGLYLLPSTRPRLLANTDQRKLERPLGASLDRLGRIAVLDRALDGVAIFDAGAQLVAEISAADQPVDVASDERGRTYVLVGRSPRVLVYGLDLKLAGGVGGSWVRPAAIDVDALGNVYVLDRAERRIDIVAPNGELLERLGPILPGGFELRAPEDLAVDGQGRLFVVDERYQGVLVID